MRKLVFAALLLLFLLPIFFVGSSEAGVLDAKTLAAGENYIHGSTYYDGYLWFSTRTSPTILIKMNPTTLDYESETITGQNSGEDVEAAENYIWIACRDSGTLIKVNPNNLADWSEVLDFGTNMSHPQSLVYFNNYLYVGGVRKIARVNLTDFSYDVYDFTYGVIGGNALHALTNSSTSIWATTNSGGHVLQINPDVLSDYNHTDIGSDLITDDLTYLNGSLFFGTESSPYRIYKVNGANISDYTYADIGMSKCYGVASYGDLIYGVYLGASGVVRQINQSLGVIESVSLPEEYDDANEVVFDDEGILYITCWLAPARIVKYQFPVSFIYNYVLHGPYYENGNVAPVIVKLTLEFENTYSKEYSLDGSGGTADLLNITSNAQGVVFTWNFTEATNYTRVYYLTDETFEELWIFIPNTGTESVYLYTFELNNFAGVGNPFMETIINVAGQNCIVERQSAQVVSSIPFYMVYGRRYTLHLISDEGTYTWGDYVALSDTDITLTVRGVDFPKSTLYKFKYVRVYGLRAFDVPYGNITIIYEDLLNMTSSVNIYINYLNGSNAYNATETQDAFVHEWCSALNTTDYLAEIVVDHERYGEYTWKQSFPRAGSSENPWDTLAFLGNLPFNPGIIFGAIVIVAAGGAFSMLNPEVGAFVACATATLLWWMGWFPVPLPLLIAAWVLSFLFALAMAKRRVNA